MSNYKNIIEKSKTEGTYRTLNIVKGLDFSSNDYLGLSKSSFLKYKLIDFIKRGQNSWPSSSRLISGTTSVHLETERIMASFLGSECSLIFSSGYCANVGVVSTLCENSIIFSDELNHASLIDGIKLSRSSYHIYPHDNLASLEVLLQKYVKSKLPKFIITEALFSMNGTLIDLSKVLDLCEKYNTFLIIDEAHSTGVFGHSGQGLLGDFIFDKSKVVSIHTCGKALGAYGAFIGCSELVKDYLVNKCRHFIYTTALPPLNVFIIKETLAYIRENKYLRDKLMLNIFYARKKLDFRKDNHNTQIIPLILRGNKRVSKVSEELMAAGINVKAIRSPTVPRGLERLRISIHADHEFQDIDDLAVTLKEAITFVDHGGSR